MNARFLQWSLAATLMLVSGCNRNNQTSGPSSSSPAPVAGAAEPKSKGVIGLSVLSLTNPFFKQIADSMTDEARQRGYSVSVVSGEFDVAKQQNQVKDFVVKKVVAIVLTPCDSKSIGPAIQEANDAGIPVFTADIACLAPGAKVVALTVIDILMKPELVTQAWDYFRNVQTKNTKYIPLIRPEDKPAIWLNEQIMAKYRPEMKKYYYDPTKYKSYLEQLGIKYPTVRPAR